MTYGFNLQFNSASRLRIELNVCEERAERRLHSMASQRPGAAFDLGLCDWIFKSCDQA
jgi:hypothetical protein